MKNVSFFDFALREKKKKRKENWNLTKIIKKNARNVDEAGKMKEEIYVSSVKGNGKN